MYNAQEQLHSFLRNFPNRPVAFILRRFIFPRGRTYSSPADDLGRQLVDLITHTGEARDRLSEQAYTTLEPGNPLGLLQEALVISEQLAPLEEKLRQARKEGLIKAEYVGHQIDEAEIAEVISQGEATQLRDYHQKVLDLMAVDDFAADEMSRRPSGKPAAGDSTRTAKKKPAKKTARKKSAKKKVSQADKA
jgi:acyl-CoA dehydrogenase